MFPPLFTGKLLRLAPPVAEDQEIFAAWTRDDAYLRMLDDDPVKTRTAADYNHFGGGSEADNYYFHLVTLADETLIGFVVLFNIKWSNQSAEMAIGIGAADYRGKGYGQDALRLILNYAFSELNLYRVGLSVMDYNTAAIKAYERAGFQKEGVRRGAVQRHHQRYDLVLYGILREEWQNISF
ncbi:MAG: GNAT family protein [Anaerolineae bacterium]